MSKYLNRSGIIVAAFAGVMASQSWNEAKAVELGCTPGEPNCQCNPEGTECVPVTPPAAPGDITNTNNNDVRQDTRLYSSILSLSGGRATIAAPGGFNCELRENEQFGAGAMVMVLGTGGGLQGDYGKGQPSQLDTPAKQEMMKICLAEAQKDRDLAARIANLNASAVVCGQRGVCYAFLTAANAEILNTEKGVLASAMTRACASEHYVTFHGISNGGDTGSDPSFDLAAHEAGADNQVACQNATENVVRYLYPEGQLTDVLRAIAEGRRWEPQPQQTQAQPGAIETRPLEPLLQ